MNTEKNRSLRDEIFAQAAAFLYRPPFVINPVKDEPPSPEGSLIAQIAACLFTNPGPEVATSIRPNNAVGLAVKRAITFTLCTELRSRSLGQNIAQSLRIRNIVASGFTVDPTIGFCEDVTTYRYDPQMALDMSSRFWQGVVAGLFEGLVLRLQLSRDQVVKDEVRSILQILGGALAGFNLEVSAWNEGKPHPLPEPCDPIKESITKSMVALQGHAPRFLTGLISKEWKSIPFHEWLFRNFVIKMVSRGDIGPVIESVRSYLYVN